MDGRLVRRTRDRRFDLRLLISLRFPTVTCTQSTRHAARLEYVCHGRVVLMLFTNDLNAAVRSWHVLYTYTHKPDGPYCADLRLKMYKAYIHPQKIDRTHRIHISAKYACACASTTEIDSSFMVHVLHTLDALARLQLMFPIDKHLAAGGTSCGMC